MNELEMRMYFFVNYQFMGMQKGIQAGHSLGEFLLSFGRYNPDHIIWKFLENHKTFIVLNGGTTNDNPDKLGTLNEIESYLLEYNKDSENEPIDYSTFREPDIQDALTAICFVCDERVWNYEDYPEFVNYVIDAETYLKEKSEIPMIELKIRNLSREEDLTIHYPDHYEKWEKEVMGGYNNVFLRELIKGKKLA